MQFAQCMRRFGSHVTIITHGVRLLEHEDEDVSSTLTDILKKEGIALYASTTINKVHGLSGHEITLHGTVSSQDKLGGNLAEMKVKASHLLLATGRMPNTESLALENADITTTSKGYIAVDSRLRSTSAPDVWAVGDCAGSLHFTHAAYDDFRIVLSQLSSKSSAVRETTGRQIPFTLFTSLEVARVGPTE